MGKETLSPKTVEGFEELRKFCESINLIPLSLHPISYMPYRVDIHIGSDNDSRRVSRSYLKKVREWANATFPEGYTLVRGEGSYRGISEDSILLYVFSDYDTALRDRLERLKRELKQDSILIVKSTVDVEVV